MWHLVLLAHVPAGNSAVDKIDTRAEDELVVRQDSPAREGHGLRRAIHINRPVMDHIDPLVRQSAIRVANRAQLAKTTDIKVGEKAGVIGTARLDQRDINLALAVAGQIARSRCAPRTTTNHNNLARAAACGAHMRRA